MAGTNPEVSDHHGHDLIDTINSHPLSGTDYFACIQCGRCVGSCPAAQVNEKFNMRLINRRIIDNDWSIIEDEIIWDCFYCQACVNLCPRDNIDCYKTILILRDLALERGHGISHMKNVLPVMDMYLDKGVLADGPSWMDAGAVEEVKAILQATGLQERVEKLKAKHANSVQGATR